MYFGSTEIIEKYGKTKNQLKKALGFKNVEMFEKLVMMEFKHTKKSVKFGIANSIFPYEVLKLQLRCLRKKIAWKNFQYPNQNAEFRTKRKMQSSHEKQ